MVVWVSCEIQAPGQEGAAGQSMHVGTWNSKILRVVKNTINGTDSSATFDVNPQNYQEVVGLKTATVHFREDGTYAEEYILPDDQVAYGQQGYWFILGDTVIIAQYLPLKAQAVYRYHFEVKGDTSIFRSLMDYDKDGEADDEFYGVSVRSE